MKDEIVVGGFRLIEEVGRGGMGVVWRAEHLHQKVPAALKFITGRRGREDDFRRHFRNEVETMAALSHPGIATIFDYGDTTGRAVDAGIGEGSPYLAMEWAPGGTLADIVPIQTWGAVRDYVLEILTALGHAHARGVYHRDLKPQNVLIGLSGEVKLADFGLAYRRGSSAAERARGGSPRWMAPEQIRGSTRDHGPWTDLYGVGCLVFWLLTYRPPYTKGGVEDVLRAHIESPIPRLKSRIAVPPDIESWLRRLLAKSPQDRYRFAADAAHDLLQFPEEVTRISARPMDDTATLPDLADTELFDAEPLGLDEPSSYAEYEKSSEPVRLERRPPPPRSWVAGRRHAPPMNLVGAGLSLWGLRPIPLVDREDEQDRLWDALREVHRVQRPRAIVLSGTAGTGKSRLARWLTGRALEVGAAHVTVASHEQIGAPADGLAGAVATWFRASGLDAEQARTRIVDEFDALLHTDAHRDAEALAELAASTTSDTYGLSADARDRSRAAWLRYLEAVTRDRPMLMVFDDVHWGAETLAFIAQVLDQAEVPILFVLTVRDEALSERPVERARLAGLMEEAQVAELKVLPLAADKSAELVQRMLRLDPELASKVAQRSGGNPLFAVQLTDDWIQRGLLQVDDSGFILVADVTDELPDELRKVWASRLERFLAGQDRPKAARHAIEIAAALGHVVSNMDWRGVCHLAGVSTGPALVDSLVRDGLANRRDAGWAFCHGMFREAIEATSLAEGRGTTWHSYCADYLDGRFGRVALSAERHARHLMAADRNEEALGRILDAAELYARSGEFDRVDGLFAQYDRVLPLLDGDTRAHRLRANLHRVRNDLFRTSVDELEPLLVATEQGVAEIDDDLLKGEALFVRSRLERHRGRSERALATAEQALKHFEATKAEDFLALQYRALGELYRSLGRLTESRSAYEAAAERFDTLGDEFQLGWCELGLAATAKQKGDDEAHVLHFEAAADAFSKSRSYGALGCAYNEKGEWLRAKGRIVEARAVYQDSLAILPNNHSEVGVSQFNLGMTFIAEEDFANARTWMGRAVRSFERLGRSGSKIFVDLALSVCACGEGEWREVDRYLEQFEETISSRRLSNQDVAALLRQAGDLCARAHESERAALFWTWSRLHWERLRRQDEVAELDALLG